MSHSVGAFATISATLQRTDTSQSWGFRLRGGSDFNSAVLIDRVVAGSLADRCGLRSGDVVKGISGEPALNMRHEDAHDAILRAGNFLKLELQRRCFDEYSREDDDRATTSSVCWSRSGAGSKTPVTEASTSTLLESYDARTDPDSEVPQVDAHSSREEPKSTYPPPWRSGNKLYERERPKEVVAVVDEFKQHRENNNNSNSNNNPDVKITARSGLYDVNDADKPEQISVRPSIWCPPRRQTTQSKSFLMLQSMLESGEEDPKIARPIPALTFRTGIRSESDVESRTLAPEDTINEESGHSASKIATTLPITSRPHSTSAMSPSLFGYSSSPAPPSRSAAAAYPTSGRASNVDHYAPPPPVPVPRRSPGPRPTSVTSPLPHQPRAFRPGAAIRSAAANSASRIPVCYRCSRNIRGPFVVALDKTFCPEHFTCDKCGTDMVEIGFVETPDGHIYCEDDYGRYMAPRCHRCRQAIIGTIVKALSAEWHTECFTCAHCNKSIAGGLFHIEDGKPYCESDYNELFTTKCKGCDFPIEAGDRWVEAAGDNYHVTCLNCTTCQCALANRGFVMRNGKPYCKTHARGI